MNARMYSDQIIERSRDMMAMMDACSREEVRAALLDIVLSVAKPLADRTVLLMEQQYGLGSMRRGKLLRDTRTLWRTIIRRVKYVYDNHPIHERHLYAVLAVYHGGIVREFPKVLSHDFSYAHQQTLLAAYGYSANHTILTVLKEHHEHLLAV